MNSKLEEAINSLYSVFGCYPLNSHMHGSPLYDELPTWNRALASKPLRSLSADDLARFCFKTMTTWGDVDDFRHFLPRIFELLATLDTGWEEWVVLDKLQYGKWHTWPANEQAAVCCYLLALWQELLGSNSEQADAAFNDYFPAIANVLPGFSQLLNQWIESENPLAMRRLVCFTDWNAKMILRRKELSGFDKSKEKGALFIKWLTSAVIIDKLTTYFFQQADNDYATQASGVIQLLETVGKTTRSA